MRRSIALAAATLAAAGAGAQLAAAAVEQRVSGWPRMALAMSGRNVVYSTAGVTHIPANGGYDIYRTATFTVRMNRAGLVRGSLQDGVILRTSAGATTGGALSGDATGRYVLLATGSGFTPQVIFCCRTNLKDYPVEASGRPDAPVTLTAALQGPVVRYVTAAPDGTTQLATRYVKDGPGEPFTRLDIRPLGAKPITNLIASAPGIVAWVDKDAPGEVRLAVTPAGDPTPVAQPSVPVPGSVLRVLVTEHTLAVLVQVPGEYRLIRYDVPDRTPKIVWRGIDPPGAIAAGDRTIAIATDGVVRQHVPGQTLRTVFRPRGRVVALATDGTRIAVLERVRTRTRRGLVRQSAITVVPVKQPPAAYAQELTR
jgi:hypothetical protein